MYLEYCNAVRGRVTGEFASMRCRRIYFNGQLCTASKKWPLFGPRSRTWNSLWSGRFRQSVVEYIGMYIWTLSWVYVYIQSLSTGLVQNNHGQISRTMYLSIYAGLIFDKILKQNPPTLNMNLASKLWSAVVDFPAAIFPTTSPPSAIFPQIRRGSKDGFDQTGSCNVKMAAVGV